MATTWLSGLGQPHGVSFRGNYLYVANRNTNQILQVPINPDGSAGAPNAWVTFVSSPFWILIYGDVMYVTLLNQQIAKITFVGDAAGTVNLSWASPGTGTANGIVISGNYLYVADGGTGSIVQINLSDGTLKNQHWVDPALVYSFHSLVVQGNFMYATNGSRDQVSRIEINPDGTAGSIVQEWATLLTGTGYLTELIIAGPYIYVANSSFGTISQVRMSDGSLVNSIWASGFTNPHSFALRGGCLYVANYDANGSISRICSSDLSLSGITISCDTTMNTFQAFRPRSSSEFLALRRLQIQQSLNTVPSINYQDSSEQTARVRKYASAVPYKHNGEGWKVVGDSATMVKYKASSVVQANREGLAYRAAASRYEPRVEYRSPGCSTLLSDPITFPKSVGRSYTLPRAAPRVVPFNPTVDLPLRENDNKVVISRSSANTAGCGANQ